ncbi:MAG TPA: hypothetical protein VFU47_14300 [Armatimonadota bacterium]|nr:hypothetical protein [Armatimonadota bacterium]
MRCVSGPEDTAGFAERMKKAYRSGRVRRIAEELRSGKTTPEAVAEDIFAAIRKAEEDYTVPGLASLVLARLEQWAAQQDEGRATALADVDPEEIF